MREPNRKNTKGEKNIENASKANERKADKEKIKELAKKKREMQEELDELKGNTAKGKAVCVLVFFVLTGLLMGAFAGMVKLDIGGVASTVLAPVIADVPVLRSILPAELQKKNASELAAEQKQQEAAAAAEAEQAAEEAEEEAAEEAEEEAQQAAAAEEAAEAEQAAEEEAAEEEAAAEEAAAEEAKALQDYADSRRHQGIYDISDLQFIKCQVIITEEIDNDNFKWLSALTDKLTESKARDVISTAYAMPQGENKRLAEVVVLAMHDANSRLFEKIKEDQTMASSLFELMRPEIDNYAEKEVDKKVKEERTIIAQIVSALVADKNNDTIIRELNCTLDQIAPIRAAMGK